MDDDRLQQFDRALRRWAARPPATPPREAAAQVAERLAGSQRGSRSRWLVAAAAVLAVAVAGVELSRHESVREDEVPAAVSQTAAVSLTGDEVLIWLDEETPLYMTLSRTQENGGS